MAVFMCGSVDEALESELVAHGLDLTREDKTADCLVTVAPPVELITLVELDPNRWVAAFDAFAREPFFAVQPWLRDACERAQARGSP